MPTKDITSGTTFLNGDTAPVVRTKLNDNLDWAEQQIQGVEDRLEGSLDSYPGNGVISGCAVSAGTGLSVNVITGQAIIGYLVDVAAHTNDGGTGITDNATNYCWLRQDDTLEFTITSTPPTSQANILLATVVAAGGAITSVNNRPVGRSELLPKANTFTCASGVAVGEAVYISAANTVAKAKANSSSTMPAVGVIIAKPTTTTCQVARPGEISDVHSALSIGSRYFVSAATAGVITATKPDAPNIAQILGIAISASQLLLLTDATDDNAAGGGGGGAPTDASYVTILAETGLSNESVLGSSVIMKGTLAARPADLGEGDGILYWTTDQGILYRWNALALQWDKIAVRDHADLDGVGADDHHVRLHALSGVSDHSGALGVGQHGTLADGDHTVRISGKGRIRLLVDGVLQGTREAINLITGAGVVLTPSDDPGTGQSDEKVDVTVEATGGGGEPHNILSATHLDADQAAAVRGDLIAADATPLWKRIAIGIAGKFLRSDGNDPSWQVIGDGDLPATLVKLTGDQTIAGVKTFGSIPVLPASSPTTDNQAARKAYVDAVAAGLTWKAPVIDKDLSTPPGSPSTGDRYLVKTPGAGAWAGHDEDFAEWNGSAWVFTDPVTGWAVITTDDNKGWTWDGSAWIQFSASEAYTAGAGLDLSGNEFSVEPVGVTNAMLAGLIANDKLLTVGETKGGTGKTGYAQGDLLYASAVDILAKLGIGSAGQVLKVVSGLPEWQTVPSGTGDMNQSYIREITSDTIPSGAWINVLSTTITPSSDTSEILILARCDWVKDNANAARNGYMRVTRNGIEINVRSTVRSDASPNVPFGPTVILCVDAPASAAEQTYSIECFTYVGTLYCTQKELTLLDLATPTGGEVNTGSNVGTAGVGVFKQKTGVNLEFKKINAGSSKVTITDDVANNEVDIDVDATATPTASKIPIADGSGLLNSWLSALFTRTTFGYSAEYDNGNGGSSKTIAWNNGNMQKLTLNAATCAITFTAPTNPGRYTLRLIQDGTGGRAVTWATTIKWAGGTEPVWVTTASRWNIATFYYDGTNYSGVGSLNFGA